MYGRRYDFVYRCGHIFLIGSCSDQNVSVHKNIHINRHVEILPYGCCTEITIINTYFLFFHNMSTGKMVKLQKADIENLIRMTWNRTDNRLNGNEKKRFGFLIRICTSGNIALHKLILLLTLICVPYRVCTVQVYQVSCPWICRPLTHLRC